MISRNFGIIGPGLQSLRKLTAASLVGAPTCTLSIVHCSIRGKDC
jgi:hypothetical protein